MGNGSALAWYTVWCGKLNDELATGMFNIRWYLIIWCFTSGFGAYPSCGHCPVAELKKGREPTPKAERCQEASLGAWLLWFALAARKSWSQIWNLVRWVWVNTYRYIFSGMNIHLPAILGFTRYQGFDPSLKWWWMADIGREWWRMISW